MNMMNDMANYIKKLTEENEKLKEENKMLNEENYKLNDDLCGLYNCMDYWRDKYYKQCAGISTQLKLILKDTIKEEDNVL